MIDLPKNLENKLKKIISFLENKKVIVGFSGGVDSSLLAFLSNKHSKVTLLITVRSRLFSDEEVEESIRFSKVYEIPLMVIEINLLKNKEFRRNPENRCYTCKKKIFGEITKIKDSKNFDIILDGSNTDDLSDLRPGMEALKELNISTPYIDFNVNKKEIREICKFYNLEVHSKPSTPCLASRIPYNQIITGKKINIIKEGEKFLKEQFNLKQLRVRFHEENLARIEFMQEDLTEVLKQENLILIKNKFKELGFCYITIDIEGFRSGSMNEILTLNIKNN